MIQFHHAFAASVLALATATVAAEEAPPATVGELLSRGGTSIPAQELRTMLTNGKNWRVLSDIIMKLTPDGSFEGARDRAMAGTSRGVGGRMPINMGVIGTWTVDDRGQLCLTYRGGPTAPPVCRYWYRWNDKLYGAGSGKTDQLQPRAMVE